MKQIIVIALSVLSLSSRVDASCSGSGTSWTCKSGTSSDQISSTLRRASDGATLTFDAGSYRWDSQVQFSATKAATLICATAPPSSAPWGAATTGGCEVIQSASFVLPNATTSKLYRISGFDIALSGNSFWAACPGGTCSDTIVTSIRADHNTITRSSAGTIVLFSDNMTNGYVEGVIDHNRLIQPATRNWIDLFFRSTSPHIARRLGSARNLFVEDNSFELTGSGSDEGNGLGCVDGGDGVGVVMRFNASDNCRLLMHGVTHGWGPTNFEVYYNTLRKKPAANLGDGYRLIHHQGSGTYMVFGNVLAQSPGSGHSSDAIVVLHYRAFQAAGGRGLCDGTAGGDGNRNPTTTYRGYPCYRQAGRDEDAVLYPMYAWGNTWEDDGSKINLAINAKGGSPDYTSQHIVSNRDLYNAVSANAQTSTTRPFNGSTGMGFGTLANRPATCTANAEPADAGRGGVGYWATDQGEWNASNGATADGQLYTCTSTNTWTLAYTPYCYPHPLTTGGVCTAGGGARRVFLGNGLPLPLTLSLVGACVFAGTRRLRAFSHSPNRA
jgi:hypothetical protein